MRLLFFTQWQCTKRSISLILVAKMWWDFIKFTLVTAISICFCCAKFERKYDIFCVEPAVYPPGNQHIPPWEVWNIIDSKVPIGVGYVSFRGRVPFLLGKVVTDWRSYRLPASFLKLTWNWITFHTWRSLKPPPFWKSLWFKHQPKKTCRHSGRSWY